jgi:hypothetical protein
MLIRLYFKENYGMTLDPIYNFPEWKISSH